MHFQYLFLQIVMKTESRPIVYDIENLKVV